MKRILVVLGLIVLTALVAGLVVALTIASERSDREAEAALAAALVAAVTGVLAIFFAWWNSRGMSADIRRLAELQETSLEEARSLRPDLDLSILVGEEGIPATSVVRTRRPLLREVDVEAICASARDRALASLPTGARNGPNPRRPAVGIEASLAALSGALGFGSGGPATEEERAAFEKQVDEYVARLRSWVTQWLAWKTSDDELIFVFVRYENNGRVPARDIKARIRFPDGFDEAEDELPPDVPQRPRFQRRSLRDLAYLNSGMLAADYARPRLPLVPAPRNVSRPRYEKGSLLVKVEITKLLHGIPEDAEDAIIARVKSDGVYQVPWEMHAENLPEPARGELEVTVRSEPIEGPPITTLDELLALSPYGHKPETES